MLKSKELLEKRAQLIANARVIVDGAGQELSEEQKAQVDAMFAESDKLKEEAENAERAEKLERQEAELRASQGRKVNQRGEFVNVSEKDRKQAFRNWCLAAAGNTNFTADEEVKAAQCGMNLRNSKLSIRALSKGTDSAGGYTVPVTLADSIEKKMKYYSDLRSICKHIVTDGGETMNFPVADDTGNVASKVSENGSIATNVDMTFSQVQNVVAKWATPTVLVSVELLQDSGFDIEAYLAEELAIRMVRGQEAEFVTGATGILTGLSAGVNLATGNPITSDKLYELVYKLDRAYRQNASWLVNDDFVGAVRLLKDSTGQSLWSPGLASAGEPDRLCGYPIHVSNAVTAYTGAGDNVKIASFADHSKYLIRDVGPSTQIMRINELYFASGQVGFCMLQRTGCNWLNASAGKTLNSFDS
mgnify:CR=1 FL=1